MEEITKREQELPSNEYRVINIEKVGDYLFVETNVKSLLIDKDKNVFDVGKCNHVEKVFKMGDDIFAVLEDKYRQILVNIKTQEIYISQSILYYSNICKIDDDYVSVFGADCKNQLAFNIHTKKFIEPEVDIPVDYNRKIGPNLFLYINHASKTLQYFLVDQDGKLIYKCGEYFPYFTDGDLILSLRKENEIVIVRDVYKDTRKVEMVSQNEMVNSNPLIHENEKHEADAICFVSGKDFTVTDLKMNIINKYSLDINYDEVKIQLWGDVAVVIVKKGEESYNIGLNIKSGIQIRHRGIWVLPLDVKGPTVIRGCDVLGKEDYIFTIYDENGNEYTHHRAKDCDNILCRKMNLIGFYGIEGMDGCLIYNIDTKEEKIVSWQNPEFKLDDNDEYEDIGFGIRYGDTWEDVIIDLFDEDMNVLYEGIIAKDYGIIGKNFAYKVKNNLLLLKIPESSGSRTYYRKVVLDKEKNTLYDSFDGYLSFVGNFLQIIDREEGKTYYIDSRTYEKHDDMRITMKEFGLPDMLNVNGEQVKLMKKNEDIYSE